MADERWLASWIEWRTDLEARICPVTCRLLISAAEKSSAFTVAPVDDLVFLPEHTLDRRPPSPSFPVRHSFQAPIPFLRLGGQQTSKPEATNELPSPPTPCPLLRETDQGPLVNYARPCEGQALERVAGT